MKSINKKMSLSEVVSKYPETNEIMIELGFKEISKPGMLKMMGKIMSIEKGAKMKNIDLEDIKRSFAGRGFQLI